MRAMIAASAGWHRFAFLERQQVRNGPAERAHLDDAKAGRNGAAHVRAVVRRCEKDGGALVACAHHLLLDAADRADVAIGIDLTRARDEPASGEVVLAELVDKAKREHHSGARPTDVADLDLHLERERVPLADVDADRRLAAV